MLACIHCWRGPLAASRPHSNLPGALPLPPPPTMPPTGRWRHIIVIRLIKDTLDLRQPPFQFAAPHEALPVFLLLLRTCNPTHGVSTLPRTTPQSDFPHALGSGQLRV